MLVAVFGTSTAYAYWGFSVVGHVMDVIHGSHFRIHCLHVSELRDSWQSRDGRAVLVTTDRPEVDLSRLLTSSGFPCLAFVDAPDDAMANAMRANRMPLYQAIRFSTQYFSCLGHAVPVDKVRIFGSSYYQATLGDLISDLLMEIVGSVDEVVKSRILERIAPELPSPSEATVQDVVGLHTDGDLLPGRARNQLSLKDQGLIKSIAEAYRPIFEKRELAMIEWPREMFCEGTVYPGDIALVGAARHIIWGPYLYLPPGEWRVTIQFEVVENISGNEIEADVCVGMRVAAVGRTILPAFGSFEFFLDFAITDPNLPIEIRVLLLKGAIEGRFGLRRVTLDPIKSDLSSFPGHEQPALRSLTNERLP